MGKAEQQFEHLTDAQIEHYGDRTSGEGPNQNGLEIDQAIETHLADCAGCRIRVLEFHRSRFGLMSDPFPSAPSYSPSRSQGDPDSSRSAETGGISSLSPTNLDLLYLGRSDEHRPAPDCPTADSLRDLAAGLSSSTDAPRLTQHAAQCSHCGPILRAYTEDFSDDLTSADEALLSKLKSSSPEWQKKMAQQMAAAVAPVSATGDVRVAQPPSAVHGSAEQTGRKSRFRLPSLRWILAPVALAAAAVIAFFIWNAQRTTPEKVEKLLAQAYTERRTMEMRWPNAQWGQIKTIRGQTGSWLDKPSALAHAQRVTGESRHTNPYNPEWMRVEAEVRLMEWQPELAEKLLHNALAMSPESPPLEMDLAIAYFQDGLANADKTMLESSLNLLTHILRTDPNNTTALFNRAVLYEQLQMPELALKDWSAVVRLETDAEWREEAKKHISSTN